MCTRLCCGLFCCGCITMMYLPTFLVVAPMAQWRLCCGLLCCGCVTMMYLPTFLVVAPMSQWRCHNASEVIPKHLCKIGWCLTTLKHNKLCATCIFIVIFCICPGLCYSTLYSHFQRNVLGYELLVELIHVNVEHVITNTILKWN